MKGDKRNVRIDLSEDLCGQSRQMEEHERGEHVK